MKVGKIIVIAAWAVGIIIALKLIPALIKEVTGSFSGGSNSVGGQSYGSGSDDVPPGSSYPYANYGWANYPPVGSYYPYQKNNSWTSYIPDFSLSYDGASLSNNEGGFSGGYTPSNNGVGSGWGSDGGGSITGYDGYGDGSSQSPDGSLNDDGGF